MNTEFLAKVSPKIAGTIHMIDAPKLSPWERMIRRLSHRNERNLYHRKCDLTGEMMISTLSPDKAFTVYINREWWGDRWSGKDYGRDFDFSRPFFEQFAELQAVVPRINLLQSQNENSDYTNCVSHLKDCYLLFSSDYNRDCYYGTWNQQSTNCMDNIMIESCELSYDCVFSKQLYNCVFVLYSNQCTDSAFLMDCRNCRHCFMSTNLRNKEYCIMNKQYTKEEYEVYMKDVDLGSHTNYQHYKTLFLDFMKQAIYPHMRRNGRIENSTGDFLMDVMNCQNSYSLIEAKDVDFVQNAWKLKDAQDCSYVNRELGYENCECFPMPTRSAFNLNSYDGNDVYYSDLCMNSSKLFGCIGLKRETYCILNKQYTKEVYESLLPRIIEHMKQTGEWGEFFPTWLSPYAYNETNAQDVETLDEAGALAKGYRWKQDEEAADYQGPVVNLPDHIQDVDESVCTQILRCEQSGQLYKIIPQELAFYKRAGLPLPRLAFNERHLDRLKFMSAHKLWERQCTQCQTGIWSSLAPKEVAAVYCEECYKEKIYG